VDGRGFTASAERRAVSGIVTICSIEETIEGLRHHTSAAGLAIGRVGVFLRERVKDGDDF